MLIEIETLSVFRGSLTRRALALVEWAALHRLELREDWRRSRAGQASLRSILWIEVVRQMALLRIREAEALEGFKLRLTLTDGSVIKRDVRAL